ncbi:MAG: hypothetical protein LBU32_15330 [Clostridiales bacterium]|jgi:hypothetical protein|nr:hypothetical protein [Clostridiales bacterium]
MKKRILVMLASILAVLMVFSGFQLLRCFAAERDIRAGMDSIRPIRGAV